MKEVGTLKELDVKPGDVVEYMWYTGEWTRGTVDVFGIVQMDEGGRQDPQYSTDPNWRIISRANTQKLWRDMSDAEKGALLLAFHNDKKCLEIWLNGEWVDCGNSTWKNDRAYRIRPEPKIEVVDVFWKRGETGYTHRITFTTIDGKPDCASIKMEAI